jgi:TetR/AcrR family transcriptional repressor of nem operon
MENILSSQQDPKTKFDTMLEAIIELHRNNQAKCGCVFGNLAIEMSEHDEAFREKLETVFDIWTEKLKQVFDDMILPVQVEDAETSKLAQGIVAMIEGGILLMKNKQDIGALINVTEQAKTLVNCFVQRHTTLPAGSTVGY